ncbi:MAG TPA: methyl-accepting chemotaxis protein [Terriglobales bacterium]|nr:methyl-accepting chemotaxis protein [Terriglobales bacterium]
MRLTLGRKLGLGFGVILGLIVVDTTLTYLQANAIKMNQDRAMGVSMPTLEACRNLQKDLNQTQSKGREAVLAGTETARRESARKLFDEAWGDIEKDVARMDELAPQWALQQNRDLLVEVKKRLPDLRRVQEEAMGRAASSERDAILHAGNEFADHATMIAEAIKKPLGDMADSFIVLLKQNKESLNSDTRLMNLTMAGTMLIAVAIGIFVAVFLSRRISGATQSVLAQAEAIAAGDLTRDEMNIRSEDELGDLANAINKMSVSLKRMILAIAENAVQVASASEDLNTTSQQITANSEETSAQADVVSKAAEQVSQNLQTVATGAEEMGASIREIAKNASEAAKVATSAVKVAETATATVSKLGDSSTEIGQVIKVITSIAQQTNLLALNATIEAARAGEAGKGFAVVANEVKELAKETAKATEDISRKIEAIQTDTEAAVDAIASISGVIHQINDISSTIATAVEEQNATTNEMSRNVSEAAHGSGEITSSITGVAEAALGTTRGATDTQKASQQLVETSTQLRRLVEQFKINASENGRGKGAAVTRAQSRAAGAGS